jgi:PAS domain S-box-containing protein
VTATGWRVGRPPSPALDLPLDRLGQRVGSLRVPHDCKARALDEILPTLAALVLRTTEPDDGQEARASALALVRAALAGAETFVWEWDIDSDRLSDIDQGFLMLGYGPGTGAGRTQDDWNALIHPDERNANHEAYLRHARGEADIYEHTYRARDAQGRWRWLIERGRIVERHPDGRPRRMLGTQTDVTLHREMEAEAAQARERLSRAREDAAAAEAANRAKTEFLSRMSHELRTPLNAVLGFAQLLEIDPVEPPGEGQKRRLKLIREAGAHLLQMIGDLLDLTRIESGGMALSLEPVALRRVVAESLEMLRAEADRAQVSVAIEPGAEVQVRADGTRLRQVVLNLLSNAIKYNRPGGRVELRVFVVGDDEVRLVVRDTGIGIAEPDLPRLFDPFFRAAGSPGVAEGSGIGLAVTKALVELMGGRIEVQSTPGAGSAFSVVLPAA